MLIILTCTQWCHRRYVWSHCHRGIPCWVQNPSAPHDHPHSAWCSPA